MTDPGRPATPGANAGVDPAMPARRRRRPSVPVLVALTLPLLLAVAVAVVGSSGGYRGVEVAGLGPVRRLRRYRPVRSGGTRDGPARRRPRGRTGFASGPECTALLAALPAELPAGGGTLAPRPLADPAPPGTRAWAAAPRPVVLRCGLTRPVELTPTSALLEVNGVRWLRLDDGVPDPVIVSYVAVDRPVYVVLTAPTGAGSGPLQAVADVVRQTPGPRPRSSCADRAPVDAGTVSGGSPASSSTPATPSSPASRGSARRRRSAGSCWPCAASPSRRRPSRCAARTAGHRSSRSRWRCSTGHRSRTARGGPTSPVGCAASAVPASATGAPRATTVATAACSRRRPLGMRVASRESMRFSSFVGPALGYRRSVTRTRRTLRPEARLRRGNVPAQ